MEIVEGFSSMGAVVAFILSGFGAVIQVRMSMFIPSSAQRYFLNLDPILLLWIAFMALLGTTLLYVSTWKKKRK